MMENSITFNGGMVACGECMRNRMGETNYIREAEIQPGRHYCPWCLKERPEIYWFRIENKALADQRERAERDRQARQLQDIRKNDHRAQYREPWRETE